MTPQARNLLVRTVRTLRRIPGTPNYGCGEGWPDSCPFCGIMACCPTRPVCPAMRLVSWDFDKPITFNGRFTHREDVTVANVVPLKMIATPASQAVAD